MSDSITPGPGALSPEQLGALMSNLNPRRVAKRSQSGSQLSYLEAWDVRASLIRVFGFGGFSIRTLNVEMMNVGKPSEEGSGKAAWRVSIMAHVELHIPQLDATYSEVAVSSQSGSTWGDVADFAAKTAVSDAMKRCAINLGTQFGLSLYNQGSTNDIVGVVFEPGQREMLQALVNASKEDPTPQHALEGIGDADPEMPDTVEDVTSIDYLAEAEAAETANEVLNIWRRAKQAGAPDSILSGIAARGEVLRAKEGDAKSEAEQQAGSALQRGFGGAPGTPA